MKKFKRILSILVAVCMLSGIAFIPVSANVSTAFADVSNDNPYAEYIQAMAEKGIIKGYGENIFAPDDTCTKEQFLTFLYRASGSPEAGEPAGFSDVSQESYYADAISWAYNNGIVKGLEDNTFGVGKTVDRAHAVTFLYEWARVTGNGDADKGVTLKDFADKRDVGYFATPGFGWAIATGIAEADGENKLNPTEEVTREWVAGAIGKIWSNHYHKWGEYKDNGDGTDTRICELDASHTETAPHTYNDGELTKAVTDTVDGEITYTCIKCMHQKKETVKAGTEVITRADVEEAIANVAWAYYTKGPEIQYDSTHFSYLFGYHGGMCRLTAQAAPEVATEDFDFYSVCSNYAYLSHYEALGIHALGDVNNAIGIATHDIFHVADNQQHYPTGESRLVYEPYAEDDVNACVMRWIDYDKYEGKYNDWPENHHDFNVYSQEDTFTWYTDGLSFKNDGKDGEVHYSYYDKDGNAVDAMEVRDNYVVKFLENYEENLRPGDIFASRNHTMLYVGNNTLLHSTALTGEGKIDRSANLTDKLELTGSIQADFDNIIRRVTLKDNYWMVFARPTNFIASEGFDADPGNDIVPETKIPEKTKSRIKYPMMDIDRTVDITHFGTAVKGKNLTYTVKISNKTNDEKYLEWGSRFKTNKKGEETYKDIKVSEKAPVGTELIKDSVTGGGKVDGDTITWDLAEIKPGETVTLTYTVKVTADVGSKIVSDGGFVDNIPSNKIENTVGDKKLDAEEKATLTGITKEEIEKMGKGTDFANAIYEKMGKDLNLPKVNDIVDNLFTHTAHIPGESYGGVFQADYKPQELFVRQAEVSDEYKELQSMLVDRYWGGIHFYVGDDLKWDFADNCIKVFRPEFLEAGDILVYLKADYDYAARTVKNDFREVAVMVYDGEKMLCSTDSNGETTYKVCEGADLDFQLLKAFDGEVNLFFALRPSQIENK